MTSLEEEESEGKLNGGLGCDKTGRMQIWAVAEKGIQGKRKECFSVTSCLDATELKLQTVIRLER